MDRYFVSNVNGALVTESQLNVCDIVAGNNLGVTATGYVNIGIIRELENPSVIDIIKNGGSFSMAIARYMEIHPGCKYEDAKKIVGSIKADYIRFNKKNKEGNVNE